ncbi:unnamed protein product, partial [Discosporangium mesarthrocarpum]
MVAGFEVGGEETERSRIHTYAEAGDLQVVRRLLAKGVDVDEVDDFCCTALHLASALGHDDIVEMLLVQYGARVDSRDQAQCTPLHAASEGGHPRVVQLLLQCNASIDSRNASCQTPLHYASGYGHAVAARLLVSSGAPLAVQDLKGNTPLHLAAAAGNLDVVRLLIEEGATIETVNGLKRSPLQLACKGGHLTVVAVLLERGADPNVTDANGAQASQLISPKVPQGLRLKIVEMLERHGTLAPAWERAPQQSTALTQDSSAWVVEPEKPSRPASFEPREWQDLGAGTGLGSSAGSEAGVESGATAGSRTVDKAQRAGWEREHQAREQRAPLERPHHDRVKSCPVVGQRNPGVHAGQPWFGMDAAQPMMPPPPPPPGGGEQRAVVGAAVAGRLEEMRSRELGASLRLKVQENEAMRLYLDAVQEEMRDMRRQLIMQASGAHDHASLCRDSGSTAPITASPPHESIAECISRAMPWKDGPGRHRVSGTRRSAYPGAGGPAALPTAPAPPQPVGDGNGGGEGAFSGVWGKWAGVDAGEMLR